MNQARADGIGRLGYGFRSLRHDGIEALAAALEQYADQIDDDVGVARRRRYRLRKAQIGLHRVDLADPAERLQMTGKLRPAHRDADAVMPVGKRAHHMTAEESGAAEHGDERLRRVPQGHRRRNTRSPSACIVGSRTPSSRNRDNLTIDDAAAALAGKRSDLLDHIFSTIL